MSFSLRLGLMSLSLRLELGGHYEYRVKEESLILYHRKDESLIPLVEVSLEGGLEDTVKEAVEEYIYPSGVDYSRDTSNDWVGPEGRPYPFSAIFPQLKVCVKDVLSDQEFVYKHYFRGVHYGRHEGKIYSPKVDENPRVLNRWRNGRKVVGRKVVKARALPTVFSYEVIEGILRLYEGILGEKENELELLQQEPVPQPLFETSATMMEDQKSHPPGIDYAIKRAIIEVYKGRVKFHRFPPMQSMMVHDLSSGEEKHLDVSLKDLQTSVFD